MTGAGCLSRISASRRASRVCWWYQGERAWGSVAGPASASVAGGQDVRDMLAPVIGAIEL
jgi:hypothetical protein